MEKYVAETAKGLRYEMDAEPLRMGATRVWTLFVYETESPLARTNQGPYCCGRVDLFLHPNHACLVKGTDAAGVSEVLAALEDTTAEAVFHLLLERAMDEEDDAVDDNGDDG
ncbi:MAG: hypothetical protein AB1609_15335 [Bacillota bacterium]